jgi:hypothetical protein
MYTIGGIRGPPSASENASDAAPKPLRAGHSAIPPSPTFICIPWVLRGAAPGWYCSDHGIVWSSS